MLNAVLSALLNTVDVRREEDQHHQNKSLECGDRHLQLQRRTPVWITIGVFLFSNQLNGIVTVEKQSLIYRNTTFTLESFDYLKEYQRSINRDRGSQVTNSEALGLLINEHRLLKQSEGRNNERHI